jgi:hypothetical protein
MHSSRHKKCGATKKMEGMSIHNNGPSVYGLYAVDDDDDDEEKEKE